MSESPGWHHLHQPAPDSVRLTYDDSGEPTGYGLGLTPMYEQPPTAIAVPQAPLAQLSARGATAGFVLALTGLATTPLGPWFTMPLLATGMSTPGELRPPVAG